MSNYTPLSALEPTPPTTVPSAPVPRQPQPQQQPPPRNLPYQATAAPTTAGAGGGETEFIDDIIAELNGTAPADAQGPAEARSDTTAVAAIAPTTANASAASGQGDDGTPGTGVTDKSNDGSASDYADACDGGTGRGLSMYDGEFWQILARGLRDPLVVGVVVAFVSSPRIQRRIGEFAPLFVGDSVQATLLRAFAAMVVYVIVCRII